MRRGKKLPAGFASIGGVVGDKEFVGIAKQVDVIVFKIAKIQLFHAFQYGRQTAVLAFDGVAEPCALALSKTGTLILKKTVYGRVTIAIGR